jgi:hypothetical protein
MNEGDQLEMTEYVLQEKELNAKIALVVKQMKVPLERLRRTKGILVKAQAAFDGALAACKPLQSDKMLLEGELELLMEKKSELRREARLRAGGGIRPGTQAFVEQMQEIAGDPEEHRLSKATQAADVEAQLAELKGKMQT